MDKKVDPALPRLDGASKENNLNCPSCGEGHDEAIFIKCKTCGFTPKSAKHEWKEANMGKQRNQPRWIAEDKQKSHK